MKVYPLNPVRFDSSELKTDLGSGYFIFVGSSCDMWAEGIPDEWLRKTFEHILKYPDNTYLFQTKNPERFIHYAGFPPFVYLGITIESNRDYKISKAPSPQERIDSFIVVDHPMKMVSIEPVLDFDVDVLIGWMRDVKPEFISIGADSKGHKLQEPSSEKLQDLISGLKRFTDVRVKENLGRLGVFHGSS